MARWHPEKKDVLDALAAEILHNYGKGRAIVAIDGMDGAGKTHFADDLAIALTDVVSNLNAGPGVSIRPLILLELKLPAVEPTAEVKLAEEKVPLRIVPRGSLI